jgi:hypothetical protein
VRACVLCSSRVRCSAAWHCPLLVLRWRGADPSAASARGRDSPILSPWKDAGMGPRTAVFSRLGGPLPELALAFLSFRPFPHPGVRYSFCTSRSSALSIDGLMNARPPWRFPSGQDALAHGRIGSRLGDRSEGRPPARAGTLAVGRRASLRQANQRFQAFDHGLGRFAGLHDKTHERPQDFR